MHTPLMSVRRRKRLKMVHRADATIINLGEMEIWDGADLALIRDTLFEMIVEQNHESVGVDMTLGQIRPQRILRHAQRLERQGDPQSSCILRQPNVREMLWFRQFFVPAADDCFLLTAQSVSDLSADVADDDDFEPITEDAPTIAVETPQHQEVEDFDRDERSIELEQSRNEALTSL